MRTSIMLVEVRVHVRRVVDRCETNSPSKYRSTIGVKATVGPSRAVLAAEDRLPVRRVHRTGDGGQRRARIWLWLDVVSEGSGQL